MSDVPVTAAWMLTFLLLTRGQPDWLGRYRLWHRRPDSSEPRSARDRAAVHCSIAKLISRCRWRWPGVFSRFPADGVVRVAASNRATEPPNELFALANIGPNAARYSTWLIATVAGVVAGAFRISSRQGRSPARARSALFALLVIAAYLIYGVFDHWSYLRFLLPAMAVFAIFAAIESGRRGFDDRRSSWRAPMLVALLLVISAHRAVRCPSRSTRSSLPINCGGSHRSRDFVRSQTPESAVILSGEQSGSMRYYTAPHDSPVGSRDA